MKLSFSLSKPKPGAAAAAEAPSLKRPAAFASLDDDEPVDAAPSASSSNPNLAPNKQLIAQSASQSKVIRKRLEAEKKVDATVFEYDEVWDKMQEAKQRQKEAKELDSKTRKPKYIEGLLTSAATRKLDHLRAEEKMMQRERELEGDEFKDKESFVTQAYKDQMAEVRRAEEEEKQREAMQKKKGGASSGMAHFYRKLLEESEQSHEATVAATQKPIIGPQPNLTISKPPDFTPKSDAELAREAKEQGKDVELNDDNQIVDKRELLSAGLNLAAPNTRNLGARPKSQKDVADAENVQVHTAVGTAASRREINERRKREIQRQMTEEEERVATEKRKAEEEAMQRIVSRRNTEGDVQSARERYLARKRQKLESAAPQGQPPD
ncbi:hypothetical protein HGRIS_013029 [Hohenbuehelia grisea]|uniref:Nuclear speckle splicing regulatory protein 1 N-terminal domain-containing protein n=1 Tax=Hohenbuehelia grisea TaxID=104357 RepID=A0ABR3IU84_9AGAR